MPISNTKFRFASVAVAIFTLVLSVSVNAQEPATQEKAPAEQESTEKAGSEKAETTDDEKKNAPESYALQAGGGNLIFKIPGDWKKLPPKSNFVEAELQIPKLNEEDEKFGRLTFSMAGGSLEANISRWEGQWKSADGGSVSADHEIKKIGDLTVDLIELEGTYIDSMGGGPFAGGKKVSRDNYRQLSAIISFKNSQNKCFVKFNGPKATVDHNEQKFKDMLASLEKPGASDEVDEAGKGNDK